MILLLTTIIIVEFKEYSHNYTEYKIGLKELGPKDLVWAGIMGSPPSYYESNEKHGLGYREFDTREIRKALEEAGINVVKFKEYKRKKEEETGLLFNISF